MLSTITCEQQRRVDPQMWLINYRQFENRELSVRKPKRGSRNTSDILSLVQSQDATLRLDTLSVFRTGAWGPNFNQRTDGVGFISMDSFKAFYFAFRMQIFHSKPPEVFQCLLDPAVHVRIVERDHVLLLFRSCKGTLRKLCLLGVVKGPFNA